MLLSLTLIQNWVLYQADKNIDFRALSYILYHNIYRTKLGIKLLEYIVFD